MIKKLLNIAVLALGSVLVLSGCGGDEAPVSAGTGTYLEPGTGTYPEPAPGAVDDGTIVPLEPHVTLPNRWEPIPDEFADANELVETITVGWNLGNALDAFTGRSAAAIRHANPESQEQAWGNALTTEELILLVRDAGFNAIRIPVTWFAMVDSDLAIREDFMGRVQEVVDFAYQNGMIVILNTHHDELMWSLFDDNMEHSEEVVNTMWSQIATRFGGYGQRLVFEGLNEPRTLGSANEWSGGTEEERNNVNLLNQVFVDTVRSTCVNYDGEFIDEDCPNWNRFLISSPYAASASAAAVDGFDLPEDPAGPGRQIVSIHMYAPYPFALTGSQANAVTEWSVDGQGDSGPSAIIDGLDRAHDTFVAHGIPVIFGEMGAQNRGNLDSRIAWAQFYIEQARERGMRTFWWDNGGIGIQNPQIGDQFALFNRRTINVTQPELITAIMESVDSTR